MPQRLSRHEARHSRCLSAIKLMQKRNLVMTHLSDGTIATDLDAHDENAHLTTQGYTVRHIETYRRDIDMTCIVWNAPAISERDVTY